MVEDPAGPCFDDDEADRLIDGRMPPDERRVRLAHFDRCPSCYDRALGFFYGWMDTEASISRTRVDRYLLGEELGHGNYWGRARARDESTGRDVAVRTMDLLLSEERYGDLLRQQSALMQLSYEHVASVTALSIDLDAFHWIMELPEGRPLEQWLLEEPRPWRAIVAALVPPLEAMLDAHRQGHVLYGFRAENLVVRDDGLGVLANFGEPIWSRSWIDPREWGGVGLGVENRYLGPQRRPSAPLFRSRERCLDQEATEAADTLCLAFLGKKWSASPGGPPAWPEAPPPRDVREMLRAALDRTGKPKSLEAIIQTLQHSLDR